MPNPLLSVRIPLELDTLIKQKEAEGRNRSEIAIEALLAYLKPPSAEDQLAALQRRVEAIERMLREGRSTSQ
ncbi:hypothetical protein BST81_02140 [Leptolyngbya sp. 'hensonii']|uniref:hypothetical protein n=1 Tax=Leptolyngbya sp. 'hensonii' TaxID=1922337 RepID=UPI00094F5EF3|nr:hypothetical protein [Leptolyngbya sp. 'hensonii']OLP20061.1 hypothetical protein BST81_02140 [Leptolyngbya sp. 'hensonii']